MGKAGGKRSQFSLATLLGGSKEKKLKGCYSSSSLLDHFWGCKQRWCVCVSNIEREREREGMLSVATGRRWRGVAILKLNEREIGKESKASSPAPFH